MVVVALLHSFTVSQMNAWRLLDPFRNNFYSALIGRHLCPVISGLF